jgi:hypothetical protein
MARKKANIHYIYKTTCNVTKRWYVGMHSTTKLDDGYMGSGKILRYSLRKYGIENHTKEILEFLPTREELVLREIEIVTKELMSDGLCMNLKEGGQGGFFSVEAVKKGRVITDKILEEKYGSDFRKIVIKNYRNSLSDDDKLILSNKIKEAHKNINFNFKTFEGKSHSEETKKLMSAVKKGTGTGETNSQYGTCWITKDGVNKKIKKEDLDTYLNQDWVKGRK